MSGPSRTIGVPEPWKRLRVILAAAAVLASAVAGARAEIALGPDGKLKLFGDYRFRLESDWDSMQSDGSERQDRDRSRMRLRFGFSYGFDEHYSFGGRLRTGLSENAQSPHQTLGDEFDTKGVNVDKAYFRGSWKHAWAWGGKNSLPFWTQNELFWDDDVTPEGVAAGGSIPVGGSRTRIDPAFGHFVLEQEDSSNRFADKSHLTAGQIAIRSQLESAELTGAAGFFAFRDNPATADPALDDLDYDIWVTSFKASFKTGWKPWSVGADYMLNTTDYPSTQFNRDQDTGYVLGLNLGGLAEKRDWLVGYYYAHIEKFAVVARLAQDDWLRWGSASETRSSNFEGHEFRVAYAFGNSWNVMARFYDVRGIEEESAAATALEDGKRLRIDLNVKF